MKRVIIVDDAIDLGRLLQDALKVTHPDIPITVVPSAEEALLESTRFTFDLLVTDLRLPGMNGVELIRKIRIRQPGIKVILMTALLPEDPLYRQKEDVNPEIFMRKPITISGFLEAVEGLIDLPAAVEPSFSGVDGRSQPVSSGPAQELLIELAAVMPGEPVDPQHELAKRSTGRPGLPLNPPVGQEGDGGLSAVLTQLRGRLNALSVILLDESGHTVAQAGDLSAISVEDQLASPVLSSLSAGAKISYLLGQSLNNSVQAYRGIDLDLVLAPVGQYALIVAIKASRSALRLALAFEEALIAQADLVNTLEEMGLRLQSVTEVHAADELLAHIASSQLPGDDQISPDVLASPFGQDQNLEKFEELFYQKNTGQLNIEDPDVFWESAPPGEGGEVSSPGVLSFEQAQKLGLFPPGSEE